MGNFQSQSEVENLKKLYSLNKSQLDKLQAEIKRQRIKNDSLVEALRNKQKLLHNRVPEESFDNVSNFLDNVDSSGGELMTYGDSFEERENHFKQKFLEEQKQREQSFYRQQNARRSKYEGELQNFKMSALNALKIFQLHDDFDNDDLKKSYRKLALKYHPDRPTGNSAKFQVITKAYMSLMEDLKMRAPQQSYNEMKESAKQYMEEQNVVRSMPGSKKFDSKLFNKIYQENKLHKPEDDGYGKWIGDNELEDKDIEKNEVFGNKFNLNVFNSTFDTSIKRPKNQIVEYKNPQAMDSFDGRSGLLGVDRIDNFGGNGFSDYKEAHTQGRLVDSESIDERKTFKSVEELEKHRKNMVPLTMAELREIESEKKKNEDAELKRQEIVTEHDDREFKVYDKMNQRMLQHDFFR